MHWQHSCFNDIGYLTCWFIHSLSKHFEATRAIYRMKGWKGLSAQLPSSRGCRRRQARRSLLPECCRRFIAVPCCGSEASSHVVNVVWRSCAWCC